MLKKIILTRQTPFWILAFSILIVLTLPKLIQDGMFMDAMLYTSVSHNLSLGIGTFWFPQFSVHNLAGLSSFHEQPPLIFGFQAIFFKILGDSLYVERFYTFLTLCITAFLIQLLWKEIYKNDQKLKRLGWLPIILWITIPVCFWSYSNNMHENSMGIFTLSAVLFIFKSFDTDKAHLKLYLRAGFFIFLATLSKGLPGFFPLTVPFLYWLSNKKKTLPNILSQTFLIAMVPIILYAFLFFIPESKESLSTYLFKRALHRISEVPTVDNRFWILYRLFMELIPQILFVGIIFSIAKIKKIKFDLSESISHTLFFLSIGLSASIPLMMTMVQKGFYMVPSFPFFAIGISIFISPIILQLTDRINIRNPSYKKFLLISVFLFIGATTFSWMQKGKVSRNKELLHDVYLMGSMLPKQSTVSIPAELWSQWDLQCYLIRYFNISLETNYQNRFCIIDKKIQITPPANFKKVELKTIQYDLYKQELPHP